MAARNLENGGPVLRENARIRGGGARDVIRLPDGWRAFEGRALLTFLVPAFPDQRYMPSELVTFS